MAVVLFGRFVMLKISTDLRFTFLVESDLEKQEVNRTEILTLTKKVSEYSLVLGTTFTWQTNKQQSPPLLTVLKSKPTNDKCK